MADSEDRKQDEDEPLAEADAVECDAPMDLAEYGAGDRDGDVVEAEASFREEIFETFQPRDDVLVPSPIDGMPVPRDETSSLATAHPFTYETMTCVEDDREYVELFDDELEERGWAVRNQHWAPAVTRYQDGFVASSRFRYDPTGAERQRERFAPEQVERRFGVVVAAVEDRLVPVRPVRERCEYYQRQIMANDDAPNPDEFGHFLIFRNCTKRRSVGGAFMTLRDEAMYACDYRSPPDPSSVEKHLDARDREALASKRHLTLVRPFGLKG